jgi:hypothetical protein
MSLKDCVFVRHVSPERLLVQKVFIRNRLSEMRMLQKNVLFCEIWNSLRLRVRIFHTYDENIHYTQHLVLVEKLKNLKEFVLFPKPVEE